MTEHSYFLLFGDYRVDVHDDKSLSNLVVSGKQKGNRCFPFVFKFGYQLALSASVHQNVTIWHRRFGHPYYRSLKQLHEQEMVLGLPKIQETDEVFQVCAMGKHHSDSFPKDQAWRGKEPLELGHSDVYGPMQIPIVSGNKYFLTFFNDYLRMYWIYFLRNK